MGGGRKARGEGGRAWPGVGGWWGGGGGGSGRGNCYVAAGAVGSGRLKDDVSAVGHCIAVKEVGQSREETAGQF